MSLQQFAATTDAPFTEIRFKARTPEQQARDLGAALIESLRREGKLDALQRNRKQKIPAMLLLLSMCYEYGQVETTDDEHITLVVRTPIKEIAAAIGLAARSAYRPVRLLEEADVLERIAVRGKIPHAYAIRGAIRANKPEPEPAASEARAICAAALVSDNAAQPARATGDAAPFSDSREWLKSAPDQELARATGAAAPVSDTRPAASAIFSTGNALAPVARASASTVRTSTLTFTSTHEKLGDGGTGGEERARKEEKTFVPAAHAGVEWLLPWLLALPKMNAKVARKLAASSMITPKLALAARFELENSAASKKPDFNPAGLIFHILTNPQKQIGERAWEYAQQTLGPGNDRPVGSGPARIQDLFVVPATQITPPPATPEAGGSIEDRAAAIQQSISQAELAALHRQAVNEAPDEFTRLAWSKSNPRTSAAVRGLIVRKLSGQG